MATDTKKNSRRPAQERAGKSKSTTASPMAGSRAKATKVARDASGAKAGSPKKKIVEPDRSAPPMAEVDAEVLEFIAAIDDFKKQHGRPFPSWSEVLLIVRQLGYRRG